MITIQRAKPADFEQAWRLVNEYFDAVGVAVRDSREQFLEYLQDERSGCWLAYSDGLPAGCIILRPLPQLGAAGREIKRLYVRPAYRGRGIAHRLLDALEEDARNMGIAQLYLDSKDDLKQAIEFYRHRGYADCERFNDNPQATVFMKKTIKREASL